VAKREENAPRRPRPSSAQRRASANPYSTVAASKRRAERAARTGTRRPGRSAPGISDLDALEAAEAALMPRPPQEKRRRESELDHETVADILANPTRFVSEEELRSEYTYVVNDIRSMALLALGLVVLLVVLASVLPTALP
jgi:hypothetical protein